MSLLYVLAFIFVFIGILLFVVSFLSDSDLGTRTWGMLFFIAAAVVCLLKYYLANQEQINNFLKSIFSK
jgi:uncharacterized membrane protein YczE